DPDNFEEKDFSGYAWLNRWKQGNESNPVDRLLSRGIAYLVWQHYGMEQLLVVPGDLLSLLLSYEDQSVWEKDAPALERETINEVAELVAPAIAVDVTRLLAYVEANEVPRTNSGIIHKSALKNAARSFSGNEDRYATFVYSVSVAAELMQPVEGLYRVTERGREWLRANHHVQLAALYLGWLYSAQWSELFPEPLAVDRLYRPAEAVIELRAAVLDLIRSFPSDTRFKLSSFLKTADFYLPSVPNAIKNLCHEEIVSKELFLSERFLSCLHLLRIVSISVADLKPAPQLEGGSASSEPQPLEWDQISFSVTGMGKLFLTGEGESPLPEREQSFVLQANGEIYLSPYLDTAVLFTVLTISDSSDKANASSLVQVTAQSIRRALDRGTTPEEILTFLKERSRTGVPQNLEYLILDLSARHGHLRIGAGSFYLVADSPHLLKEIASRKDLKGFITRNLTENVVLIKADSEDAALKRLRKAGYLPVAESKPASKSRGSSRQLVGLPDPRSIAMADGASSRKYDSIPWKEFEQEDARR
ncbi:MAG TPA: helicase-associated domain-containing protein, partial [Chthonomonadales bacterium]|nr:helicase-associated domain-containing protein [Chthonomonadales bacterium]